MVTIIVAVFEAAGLTASEKKTETMLVLLITPDETTLAPPLVIEVEGQMYEQTT